VFSNFQSTSTALEGVFTATAVTLVVVLPVDVDCLRKVGDLHSLRLSVTDPPALSEIVQVPDH